jgi:hypothetical protein
VEGIKKVGEVEDVLGRMWKVIVIVRFVVGGGYLVFLGGCFNGMEWLYRIICGGGLLRL